MTQFTNLINGYSDATRFTELGFNTYKLPTRVPSAHTVNV